MSDKIYPIGIQNFEDLRNNDCVYIDKTALIYHLTHTNKIYFLSRPRRFGKSLLVSTLEAYFSGKKELFEGLAMEQLEKEWTVYPVLHIDFSRTKYTTIEDLQEQANAYAEKVIPAMEALRAEVDALECIVERDYWPVPTYNDILFYS